jgi:anti-sigma factor RsiW
MSARTFSERDIHLALDGELPADERAGYERWLEVNPDMKALARRYGEDRDVLRAALAGVLDEPVPYRLRDGLDRGNPVAPPRPVWWRYAAAAVIFATGGLAGYVAAPQLSPTPPTLAQPALAQLADDAIKAHLIYANEKRHVVEVGVDQLDHLQGWLSNRTGVKMVAPDLKAQGYQLIGGRLLPFGDSTAAQLMYQDAGGKRLSLYLTRDATGTNTDHQFLEERGAKALYWLYGGYGCVISGEVTEPVLEDIAHVLYKQLLHSDAT